MADQTFNVKCGFFDAVDGDRTYSADDMNKPYKRIVADGVFATPEGTPSTDFQVVPYVGMVINVSAGEGIFAAKWFKNPSTIAITVPSNSGVSTRIDSVVIQVDERLTGRVGNIIYRTGGASAPALDNSTAGLTEYRLANVTVASGASAISAADIEDLRGTSACPWVAGLIQQVDTSVLTAQYAAAYEEQREAFADEMQTDISNAQTAWAQALEDLSGELTVSTNIITATSVYTATGSIRTIPIQIAGFDSSTDVLLVYINGMCAKPSMYTVSGQNIVLTNAIGSGDSVLFVCFKALINGSIASATVLLQQMQNLLSQFLNDTGWQIIGSSQATGSCDVRSIGGRVTISGKLTAWSSGNVFLLPQQFRPFDNSAFVIPVINNGAAQTPVIIKIGTDGYINFLSASSSGDECYLNVTFLSKYAAGWGNAIPNGDSVNY